MSQIYWYIALADYLKFDYVAVAQNLGPLEKVSRRDPLYWSRAMLFLGKAHVGDVQASIWPDGLREELRKRGIVLL